MLGDEQLGVKEKYYFFQDHSHFYKKLLDAQYLVPMNGFLIVKFKAQWEAEEKTV